MFFVFVCLFVYFFISNDEDLTFVHLFRPI